MIFLKSQSNLAKLESLSNFLLENQQKGFIHLMLNLA